MSGEIGATLAFGVLSALLLLMGLRRGFFEWKIGGWDVPVRFAHLIGAFAIYFIATYLLSGAALTFLKRQVATNDGRYTSWLNFSVSLCIAILLAIYWRCLPLNVRQGILQSEKHSLKEDVWGAFYAWIIAFPLVLFLNHLLELVVFKVFQITQVPDQIAVKFLKSTFANPLHFTLAILSIIVLAPLIEETLFRGFLQTYIRKHLGAKQAILITSVCFSLFHYAAGQGLGNIPIIISLFILSCFLGFLYEKRRSLLSPMVLHASFNFFSVINLYLFGGFTTDI